MDRPLVFGADSVEAWMEDMRANHPIWIMGREAISDPGEWREFEAEAIAVLEADNETDGAFRATSRYRIFQVALS